MAYEFEGAAILAPLTISSNEPMFEADTISLSKQRASQGVQRWELSFKTATSKTTEADMLVGVVTSLSTTATMVMPQLPSVVAQTTSGTSLPVGSGVAAGLSAVTVVNNGTLKKGAFVKFSNHDKVYMVTEDVAPSIASAPVSVPIYPSLRTAVTTSDVLHTGSSAVLTYYRDIDNLKGLQFSDGLLSSAGSISLTEAV